MGMVNAVIPHAELEATAYEWAQEILAKSPMSIKMLKFAMNLTDDGMVGQQVFAGEATRLAYMTEEAKEGRDAFLEKRKPNFEKEMASLMENFTNKTIDISSCLNLRKWIFNQFPESIS